MNIRDGGIPLLNFDGTDIWYAPGDEINSTDAFHHATHLEEQAYTANRWLFVSMMSALLILVLIQFPHSYIRLRSSPWNFRLSRRPVKTSTPRRLKHIRWPVPTYRVPFFDLPLQDFLIVLVILIAGLGVAGWCQSAFLTDASRSTLVVMFLLALTAGLGVKSGGVGSWLVYGYTAVNFAHRWTGRLALVLSTLHVIAYLVVFYRAGVAKQEMAKPENYLGALAYGGLCLAGIASIGWIRKRWWLVFKFGHHVGILLLLAGLNYHSGDILPYLIAIWGLIVLNTLLRSLSTRLTTATLLALPGAESTLVTLPFTSGFIPGQHVRIRLFGLGHGKMLESHPFTIASGNEQSVQLVIKRAGDWTTALYESAAESAEEAKVRCTVEGPYGGPINFIFPAFSSVMVVVGGSGISFGLGVIRGLIRDIRQNSAATKQLTLVWTVRNKENLQALYPQLAEILQSTAGIEAVQPDFHIALVLCHTAKSDASNEWKTGDLELKGTTLAGVQILNRRPDLQSILAEAVKTTVGGGVGVGACGPSAMVESMERLVRKVDKGERKRVGGIEIHAELYSL